MGLRFGHGKIGFETWRSRNDERRSKRTCRTMDAITRPCEHFSESPSTSRAGSVRSNGREKPSPRTVGGPVYHRARSGAPLEIQIRQTRDNLVGPHRNCHDPSPTCVWTSLRHSRFKSLRPLTCRFRESFPYPARFFFAPYSTFGPSEVDETQLDVGLHRGIDD
jgi:hypothetical protein